MRLNMNLRLCVIHVSSVLNAGTTKLFTNIMSGFSRSVKAESDSMFVVKKLKELINMVTQVTVV